MFNFVRKCQFSGEVVSFFILTSNDPVSLHSYFCSYHSFFFLSDAPNFLLSSSLFCLKIFLKLSIWVSLLGTDSFSLPLFQNVSVSPFTWRIVSFHVEFTIKSSFLSGVEKFILTQKPIKEETGVENSSQTVYYPALLGSITGLGTDFSSHSAPPNFGEFEMIHIVSKHCLV